MMKICSVNIVVKICSVNIVVKKIVRKEVEGQLFPAVNFGW